MNHAGQIYLEANIAAIKTGGDHRTYWSHYVSLYQITPWLKGDDDTANR